MRHTRARITATALKLAFPLAMGVAFFGAVYARFYSGWMPVRDLPVWPAYAAYFVVSLTLWSVIETRYGLVQSAVEKLPFRRWVWSLVRLDLLTFALVSVAAFFWRGHSFSRVTVAAFWSLHAVLCAAAAWAARAWFERGEPRSGVWVFLIGDGPSSEDVERECLPAGVRPFIRRVPDAGAAIEILESAEPPAGCREILVAADAGGSLPLAALAEALERQPVPGSVALAGLPFGAAGATRSFVVLSAGPPSMETFDYVFSKRLVDLTLSAFSLLLLAPVLAAIAVTILVRSGRPVLLGQERVGRGGRRFRLYKFRTLPVVSLAESDRQWAPSATDGWRRFLRRAGLDELPQLFNVLRGEMSLVGPRPERPRFVEQFRRQLPFYSTRHRFETGITGWAQVHGWRGDTSISRRVEYDLYYLRHWSLALDFRILWMTLKDFWRHLWRPSGAADARSV